MGSFFDSGPLPDWKEIKRWLGDGIPWDLAEKWDGEGDGEWLDKFMSRMAKDTPVSPDSPKETESPVMIDTEKDPKKVEITFRLPKNAEARNIRLYVNSERMRITGLPDGRTQLIRFPGQVYPGSGKATLRNGRLVVRFRRRPVREEDVELFIGY
ncbi:hypothetical protein [Cohnella caldifontis]|uniref:hypothetical protein n=1 Tax=Cohnella caldifontis TaxID=3027471 RepID=UPI0023EDAA1A|nr:hypothetical protein [Cohnella sp. YIM B05605]